MMLDLSNEQLLSCVLDSLPARLVVRDLAGRSLYTNHHHEEKADEKKPQEDLEDDDLSRRGLQFPVKDATGTVIGSCTCEFLRVDAGVADSMGSNSTAASTASSTTSGSSSSSSDACPSSVVIHTEVAEEEEDEGEEVPTTTNTTSSIVPSTTTNTRSCCQSQQIAVYQTILEKIDTAVSLNEVIVNDQNEPIDYIFLYVNPAFERFLGISAQDCVGKLVTQVIPGIEQDCVNWIQFFGKVGVHGVTEEFTQYSQRLQNWYTGVCYQTDPKRHGFAVLFHESSDRIESQEALRESEERHRNLFESMMQGVVYQDADGNIIAANPAAERILGLTVDQMMGRTSVDSRWKATREDGSDYPGHEHPSMLALKTGQPVLNQTMGVFSPKDNTNHWIKIDAVPRFKPPSSSSSSSNSNNNNHSEEPEQPPKPWQVYTTFTDITETKNFENQLLRAKQKAEEADQLKSAFLANMSHEIRTPLNGIMGHIDLALDNHLAEEWRNDNLEGLRIAKSSGSLLLSIIQDILDLSKIEAGQMVIHLEESFSMKSTIVEQTSSLAMALIKSKNKGISFSCHMDERIQDVVHGDPFRLQQVVNNLVSNAIKFTAKGKVELRISLLQQQPQQQDMIEFALLDTGKGIPTSHLEKIFEPFRQVEISDTRQHGGTGLGLTISRKLIEMMGGSLRVESSVLGPIRGSMFAFTLPYRPQLATPVSSSTTTLNASTPINQHYRQDNIDTNDSNNNHKTTTCASPQCSKHHPRRTNGEKPRILVAEDDPVSRKLVGRMLQRTGYDVVFACNGEEAVEICMSRHQELSLVLMDGQMPKLSGHEATQQIREKEREGEGLSAIPIIGLSAGAMKGDHERGLSYGMTDYLTKPVDFSNLVVTLQKYVGCC